MEQQLVPLFPSSSNNKEIRTTIKTDHLLTPQKKIFKQAQKNKGADYGRGQAFNLTAEQLQNSDDMVAITLLVYIVSVSILLHSRVSHYFISSAFVF